MIAQLFQIAFDVSLIIMFKNIFIFTFDIDIPTLILQNQALQDSFVEEYLQYEQLNQSVENQALSDTIITEYKLQKSQIQIQPENESILEKEQINLMNCQQSTYNLILNEDIQEKLQQISLLQQKQQLFNNEYNSEQREKEIIAHNNTQIKTKIKVQQNRIQLKVSLKSLFNNQQESFSSSKSSFNQIKEYFSKVKNIWEQLDQINKKDSTGDLTQMIYKEILNQKPTLEEIKQHEVVHKSIQQEALNQQDSLSTVMLCLANDLKLISDQIDVTFCQKSNLQSKVSTKVLSTGFSTFKYKCIQKIEDEQSQWTYEQLKQNPKHLQRFQQWYKLRLQKQYGIKNENIRIMAISKGSINVEWQTTNPLNIAANPVAAKRIKVHPYFKHFRLCSQDFDVNGNIQFQNQKTNVDYRGCWPYYQPIKCKRYGIKIWGLYDGGDNTWVRSKNMPGTWPVAFHGIRNPQKCPQPTLSDKKVFNLIMDGREQGKMLKVGIRNAHVSDHSVNKNQLIGNGIYCSPHLYQALSYACSAVVLNGKEYYLIFQSRVNPKKVHITGRQQYWVLNHPKDIRPYGVILMKGLNKRTYPSQQSQFNQSFTYQKYKQGIDKTQF